MIDMHGGTPPGSGSGPLPDPAATATVVVDDQGLVTGWSAGAERLLGYPHQEVVGRPVVRLFGSDADVQRGFRAVLGEHAADGMRRGTTVLRHRDGRRVEVRLRVYPSFDGVGNAQQLVVVSAPSPETERPETAEPETEGTAGEQPETERPETEGTAGEQREPEDAETFTADEAFTQCHLPVMIFDSGLRALRASAGAVRELGMSEERMRGLRVTDILPPHVCRTTENGMRRVLETGAPEEFQIRGRARPEASERAWSITVSPIRSPSGRVRHVQLSALDVTEQFRARERLALLNDVSAQVGSTLDVMRTAQEMADVAVGRLADFVTIDLLDSLFRGVEPRSPSQGTVALRRVAQQSVLPGAPEAVIQPGDVDHYPEAAPPVRCVVTGRPSLHSTSDEAVQAWQEADPARSGVVRKFGIHSIMVIPLRARGITLGVAVLVRHQRQDPFEEDDLLLAEEIGARAAVAVDNARRYTLERDTALALQRSLLPRRLAPQEAVQVAYRYLPARTRAGLGGDWFDVIPLSGARVALVVGDVVGHGLRASATMGRLRTAVRTLADVDLPPDELLTHLDDLITHLAAEEGASAEPEPGEAPEPARGADLDLSTALIATCLYVVYDPVSRRCTAATAGHPPPAVVTGDDSADFVDVPPGPPLGVGGLPFETIEWELPRGSLLVLYTDGLVEGAKDDLGHGMALLRQCLERQADRSLETTCDDLIETLLPAQPRDDVALLVARTRALDAGHVATWDLPSDPAAVADARAAVLARLTEWRLEDVSFTAELVVSELVTNAIRYGQPPIQLRLIHTATALICEVSDCSSSAPHLRRARTFDEGGRGLLLVAQFAERWGTRPHADGKTIWAEIDLPGG
ncbi:SpoIIE family protein phosphatase [Streptomyces sp. NPDC014864]|uniref:SpoIIE family protein phosphatase n=1 Tax=Streptomyces sp. NPDC014864 TaxID=3364924 RepID=UPI0036FCE664